MTTQSIFSLGLSRTNTNQVVLRIEDNHSSDQVATITMTLEELGLLITGLHGVKGVAEVHTGAHIAQKREVQTLLCDKILGNREAQAEEVLRHFEESGLKDSGWVMSGNGMDSQQNGSNHKYMVKRYVPVENPLEVERYY